MDKFEQLRNFGCDVEGTFERVLNDSDLYMSCMNMLINDASFEILGECLKSGDVKGGFDAAHTLKGIISNMGVTPMYEIIVKIVEPLRAGNGEDLYPLYEELMKLKISLAEL